MAHQWLARPYMYADNVVHNPGRWGIYFRVGNQWELVGGALEKEPGGPAVAFLADLVLVNMARNMSIIEAETRGYYVQGKTLRIALAKFKENYPDPIKALEKQTREIAAAF
jgi:hypothetical protein